MQKERERSEKVSKKERKKKKKKHLPSNPKSHSTRKRHSKEKLTTPPPFRERRRANSALIKSVNNLNPEKLESPAVLSNPLIAFHSKHDSIPQGYFILPLEILLHIFSFLSPVGRNNAWLKFRFLSWVCRFWRTGFIFFMQEMKMPSFQRLNITGAIARHVSIFTALKDLDLNCCIISQRSLRHLLSSCPALVSLQLRGIPVDDATVEVIAGLERLSRLFMQQTKKLSVQNLGKCVVNLRLKEFGILCDDVSFLKDKSWVEFWKASFFFPKGLERLSMIGRASPIFGRAILASNVKEIVIGPCFTDKKSFGNLKEIISESESVKTITFFYPYGIGSDVSQALEGHISSLKTPSKDVRLNEYIPRVTPFFPK